MCASGTGIVQVSTLKCFFVFYIVTLLVQEFTRI